MILKKNDRDGYDLDLTRFNIDEKIEIRTEYFGKMSTFLRTNDLKKVNLQNFYNNNSDPN